MGEVFLNTKTKTIKIYNEILFYGSKATKALAFQMANDIESMWNNAKGKVVIKGESYSVKFSIKGKIINSNIKNIIRNNRDKWKKFIRIEDKTKASVSYVDDLKSNTGFFQLKN